MSCGLILHHMTYDELESTEPTAVLLLQVNGSLAEVAARTAAQGWRCRDLVSSLGAVQLVQMLGFPGECVSTTPIHLPLVMISVARDLWNPICCSLVVYKLLIACKLMLFNAHTCCTAAAWACKLCSSRTSCGLYLPCRSCMPEPALAVCEHGIDASGVVQHKVAGVADTASSMQYLMELQLS